uniref:WGS project CAFE00000000 data, contig n=1 Tax=Panagrellus redivivus TaxID=6233 RepID=A0A7E4VRY3_PANRE
MQAHCIQQSIVFDNERTDPCPEAQSFFTPRKLSYASSLCVCFSVVDDGVGLRMRLSREKKHGMTIHPVQCDYRRRTAVGAHRKFSVAAFHKYETKLASGWVAGFEKRASLRISGICRMASAPRGCANQGGKRASSKVSSKQPAAQPRAMPQMNSLTTSAVAPH